MAASLDELKAIALRLRKNIIRMTTAAGSGHPSSSLSAVEVVTALFFHVMVNMLMTVGWAPVTGVPLPFLSYGGTALIVNCIQIGLLQNVALRRREY